MHGIARRFVVRMLLVVSSLTIGAVALLWRGHFIHPAGAARASTVAARTLGAPMGLRSKKLHSGQFVLSWQPVPGATSYLVFVGDIPLSGDVTRWELQDLQPGKSYRWTVRAWFGERLGPQSSTAAFTVPPVRLVTSVGAARQRSQPMSRPPTPSKIQSLSRVTGPDVKTNQRKP